MRKQRLAFSRRELKMLAKRLMFHPICMRVTLLLVGLQVASWACGTSWGPR